MEGQFIQLDSYEEGTPKLRNSQMTDWQEQNLT